MPILQLLHIQLSFPPEELLTDVNFTVEAGERIGLVGRNGSGKSTLFSLLTGENKPDGGSVFMPETRIGYLKQSPEINANPESFSDMALYYAARLLLADDVFERLETASGGERTKAALALLLAEEPSLLLLDEPTNHMDYDGIQALSQLLREFDGTCIIISHDRYFLDETAGRILELDRGCVRSFKGNYSAYRKEKERLFQKQLHRYESDRKEEKRIESAIQKTRDWAQKAHRDSTKVPGGTPKMGYKERERVKAKKLDSSARSRVKRLEKLKGESEARPQEEREVRFSISGEGSSGKRILDVQNLSMGYGDTLLFEDSYFYLNRGEHIAVFGSNGCGKSTLISLLLGQTAATSGDIWVSPGRTPYVLRQSVGLFSEEDETALMYLQSQVGRIAGPERSLLHQLGLETRHLMTPLRALSYGEKMKIRLAEPILQQKEFLILDEPTHHLDLPTREALEKTLLDYGGTLLLVSHDIFFLREICNKVLLFENGKIRRHEESFAAFLEQASI